MLKQQDTYPLSVCMWERKTVKYIHLNPESIDTVINRIGVSQTILLASLQKGGNCKHCPKSRLGENGVPHSKKFIWPLKRSISEETFSAKSSETEALRNWERW